MSHTPILTDHCSWHFAVQVELVELQLYCYLSTRVEFIVVEPCRSYLTPFPDSRQTSPLELLSQHGLILMACPLPIPYPFQLTNVLISTVMSLDHVNLTAAQADTGMFVP